MPPPKAPDTDLVTGQDVELLGKKGSGDLGTLEETLAVLRLTGCALQGRVPGRGAEDDSPGLRRHRLLRPGAPIEHRHTRPVDAPHVDHLHPGCRSPIADGERLTREIFGDRAVVGAVAPTRLPAGPGYRRDQGAQPRRRSAASSAYYGITAWGIQAKIPLRIIREAQAHGRDSREPSPSG